MNRHIPDNELRIGIGKHECHQPEPWYVTRYSRNLAYDRADSHHATYEEAAARSREILEEAKTQALKEPS